MEKVRPWCGQPSDQGRLKNRNRTVPAHLGNPGKRAVKRVCMCVCVRVRVCVVQTSELLRDLCMQNMARRYRLALSTERRQQVLVRPSVVFTLD